MQRVCLSSVIIGDEDLWTWKEAGGLEGQEIYSRENTVQNKAMEKEALGGGGAEVRWSEWHLSNSIIIHSHKGVTSLVTGIRHIPSYWISAAWPTQGNTELGWEGKHFWTSFAHFYRQYKAPIGQMVWSQRVTRSRQVTFEMIGKDCPLESCWGKSQVYNMLSILIKEATLSHWGKVTF